MTETLIAELEHEAESTRRVLERAPEDGLSWAPHPRSMTLGQLALHIARLPDAIATLVSPAVAPVPDVDLAEARSREEILDTFERSVAAAARKLAAWTADDLMAEWRVVRDGETLVAAPRGAMIRSLLLNHVYHHRGQLTVYLRLLDVPVPGVYGPSADEAVVE